MWFTLDLGFMWILAPRSMTKSSQEKWDFFFFTYSQVEIHIFCLLLSRLKNNSLFHWGYNPSGILTWYSKFSDSVPTRAYLQSWPLKPKSLGHLNGTYRPYPAFPLNTVSGPQNIFSSFYTNLFCRRVSFGQRHSHGSYAFEGWLGRHSRLILIFNEW